MFTKYYDKVSYKEFESKIKYKDFAYMQRGESKLLMTLFSSVNYKLEVTSCTLFVHKRFDEDTLYLYLVNVLDDEVIRVFESNDLSCVYDVLNEFNIELKRYFFAKKEVRKDRWILSVQ